MPISVKPMMGIYMTRFMGILFTGDSVSKICCLSSVNIHCPPPLINQLIFLLHNFLNPYHFFLYALPVLTWIHTYFGFILFLWICPLQIFRFCSKCFQTIFQSTLIKPVAQIDFNAPFHRLRIGDLREISLSHRAHG